MKRLIFLILTSLMIFKINAQSIESEYDSILARRLGADEYGMKSYVFVMLKSGTVTIPQGPERDSLFKGHLANISRLAEAGKMIVAGPLGDNDKSYRGIFILNVSKTDEAKELLMTDPAIKAKLLDYDLYEWYGSAALGEYLKVHRKIEKVHF